MRFLSCDYDINGYAGFEYYSAAKRNKYNLRFQPFPLGGAALKMSTAFLIADSPNLSYLLAATAIVVSEAYIIKIELLISHLQF